MKAKRSRVRKDILKEWEEKSEIKDIKLKKHEINIHILKEEELHKQPNEEDYEKYPVRGYGKRLIERMEKD